MSRFTPFLKLDFHWRRFRVILPLLATAALLVAVSAISMDVLSSVRAFVGGEGLYSKAQKDAVLFLNHYARSRDERDYQKFLRAIAVPRGDRDARVAIDRPDPDLAAVRQGLMAAFNHPDDIAGMIRLFRNFRNISFMSEVIGTWTEADRLIDALCVEADLLHADILDGHSQAALQVRLERIKHINLRLNPIEQQFSSLLGDASRITQDLLLWATLAIGAAVMGIGSVISRSILIKKEGFQQALRISEERLNLAMQANSDGLWDWDIVAGSIYYSPRLKELFEEASTASVFPQQHFFNFVDPRDQAAMRAGVAAYLRDNTSYDAEFRILTHSGQQCWVRARAQSVLDAAGKPVRMAGSVINITERKQAALELTRTNRALQMLSRCNEAVMRSSNEDELLMQICHLAVDIGGYRMAWVGYAQDDAARTVVPVAQAGDGAELAHLDTTTLRWDKDDAAGQGPAGRTIRGGAAVLFDWCGRSGGVCLPLRDKDATFGLLALYSSDAVSVSAEETKLLQELADDLAFGITNLRAQHEQRRIQGAVLKIAAGVSASTGTAFFQQLVHNMAEALGASAGFVGRLLPGASASVRTIAGVIDGAASANFDYPIASSPCEQLLMRDHVSVAEQVARHFSLPAQLIGQDTQAYVGRRLDNSAGQPLGVVFVLFKDGLKKKHDFITSTLQIFAARAAAEMERQETDARIRDQASWLDKAQDAIIVRNMAHRIEFWNKSAERLYGWTQEEAIGRTLQDLLSNPPAAFIEAGNTVVALGEWSGEICKQRKDGSMLTVESRWTLVRDDAGHAQSILAIDTDITQRKAAELEIVQLAFYDPLTQLPNRRLLMDRLQQALLTNARSRNSGALLFIDLDNFKTINDTLGHEQGDQLLRQVARRLGSGVRASDTVARLGGDEFVVMLADLNGASRTEAAAEASAVVDKLLAALSAPYLIAGNLHHSTASIGITLFSHADSVGDVLKRADLAMYQAKAAVRNTMRFFDPEMQAAISTRAALEADLRLALAREELSLHYQPQVDGAAQMTGVEALLRWRHRQHGMVSPAEFIPLAEESGLILPIGLWVLETACAQLARWALGASTAHLMLAVNVSVRQFRHPDFVDQVTAVLVRSGADPRRLKLEITESLMVDDMEQTIARMGALKALGVSFSLDDFGTGYSSLAYLKRLPLDQLKIDQSFVKDLLSDPNDAAIARTIVALAQSLGLAVIAEGVESEAQRVFLARLGCRAYQGYLFSRALPIDQLEAFMRTHWRGEQAQLTAARA